MSCLAEMTGTQKACAAVGAGLLVASATASLVSRRRRAARFQGYENAPKGTVVLHQIGRSLHAPSLSPFPIKLELYLRVNKIPYENDHKDSMGPKCKTPWMTFNGEHVSDSQLCIEHLNRELGIDMNKHLSPEQRATARAMRIMLEDHMYWICVIWRWVRPGASLEFTKKVLPLPSIFMWLGARNITKATHAQGMGRHSDEEVDRMGEQTVIALSDFLGKKKYLVGDIICEEDCSIFGMLCQLVWQMPGSVAEELINGKCRNLREYCERIRDEFWPDWEQCTGQTIQL